MTWRHPHRWLLLVLGLLLVAGHAVVLRYALSQRSLSAAMVMGVIAVAAIKYLAVRRGPRASRRGGHRPR